MDLYLSPSVLNADLSRLHDEVQRVSSAADFVHLDVMDNHFVPNLTFGLPVVESLLRDCPLPADCHLMIADPDRWAPGYAEVGAASVTFHVEAANKPQMVARDIRAAGARAGIAIKPGTDLSVVEPMLRDIDMILVMTVEPGFGGQTFMAEMMSKVKGARSLIDADDLDIWIQVDGGVGPDTIAIAAEAGANVFVAGSAVFRADDPTVMLNALRAQAKAVLST